MSKAVNSKAKPAFIQSRIVYLAGGYERTFNYKWPLVKEEHINGKKEERFAILLENCKKWLAEF